MSDPDNPKQTCFIIMPYADEFDPVLDAIDDAVQSIGLRCKRLDKVQYSGKISDEMVARIAKSQLCIADLTGPNQNVMWETGYAMALKRPTVLISQDASTLPFNLKDYHVFEYDLSKGRRAIALEIEAAIRDTLKQSRKGRATRWVAAAAGVVLAALAGLPIYNNVIAADPVVMQEASRRCDLIHVARGRRAPIDAKTSIKVVHIETLRGKRDIRSTGHEFNKTIPGAEEVVARVLAAAGLENNKPKDILAMTQEGWDQFRNTLPDKNRETLTDYPFVKFEVYRDNELLPGFDVQKYYFLNDIVEIKRDGAPPIKLKLEHIYNTKFYSGEDEAVALGLVSNI